MKNSRFTTNFKRFTSLTMGYRNNTTSKVFNTQTWGPGSGLLPSTLADCASNHSTVCVRWNTTGGSWRPVAHPNLYFPTQEDTMSLEAKWGTVKRNTGCQPLTSSCIETLDITHTLRNKLTNKSPHMFSNYNGIKIQINKKQYISI